MDKDDILKDAIEAYFEAEVTISKLRSVCAFLGVVCIILLSILIALL